MNEADKLPVSDQNVDDTREVVDFRDIIDFAKRNFFALCGWVLIFGVMSIAFSFTRTKTYKAEALLLAEANMKQGALSSLSAAIGISSSSESGDGVLKPEIYQKILLSSPFASRILEMELVNKEGVKFPKLSAYLTRDADTTEEGKSLFSFLRTSKDQGESVKPLRLDNDKILQFDNKEYNLLKQVKNLVSFEYDMKTGEIMLSTETEDPYVSAQILQKSVDLLTEFVLDYRSGKTEDNLHFVESSVERAKKELEQARYTYESIKDANRNPFLNVARIKEQQAMEEFSKKQSIYLELSRQLETLRIKVKEEKPVFTVLEPVSVPIHKSSPKRLRYALFGAVLGGLIGLLYTVVYKEKLL